MPCNTQRTITVTLEVANEERMRQVLNEFNREYSGYNISYANGKLQSRGQIAPSTVNKIKQMYAKESLQANAQQAGWQVQDLGNNQFKLVKRAAAMARGMR